MKLPQAFEEYFSRLMDSYELEDFMSSFNCKRHFGLRVNTLKINPMDFLKFMGRSMEPVPWEPNGFYFNEDESPGKQPAYHAGLYYIQEPSAMMPARILSPKPGDKVLDLCAAPGGKTAQLGQMMQNKGILVTNDINPKRVRALIKNVELMGLVNTFITNESPQNLKNIYPEYFDRILLDVPCSGEGMFRKDRDAIQSYSRYKSSECVNLQREIFEMAYYMLKPGGIMVYSTCTFNPDENERNIEFFTQNYDIEVDPLTPVSGFEPSRAYWTLSGDQKYSGGLRLWPHKSKGEGHFVCRLRKAGYSYKTWAGNANNSELGNDKNLNYQKDFTSEKAKEAYNCFQNFALDNLNSKIDGIYHLQGTGLYRLPEFMTEIPKIRWYKAGLYIGEYRNGRFEPSQSLAMALKPENFKRVIRFDKKDRNIIRYLKGETLFSQGENGYAVICMEDYPLGWTKRNDGTLKNLYPPGWRMM